MTITINDNHNGATGAGSSGGAGGLADGEIGLFLTVPSGYQAVAPGPQIGPQVSPFPASMVTSYSAGVYALGLSYYTVSQLVNGNANGTAQLWSYDGNVFRQLASPPLIGGYARHGLAALPSGKLLVLQSVISDGTSNSAYRYNQSTNTFTNLGAPPFSTTGAVGICSLVDGRVLVAGGINGSGVNQNTTYYYTESSHSWAAGPVLPWTTVSPVVVQLPNSLVLIAGGVGNTKSILLNPATGVITPTGDMPGPCVSAGVVYDAVAGKVYTTGGQIGQNNVNVYDPVAGTWSILETTAAFVGNYTVVVNTPFGFVIGPSDIGKSNPYLYIPGAFNVPVPAPLTYYAKKGS